MRISVVIPALNEAGNIGRLVQDTFAQVPPDCLAEVIVVDDASEDVTGAEVKALIASSCPGLRYLRHGLRSGQSAALRTGILAATSPIIATMDGDGQNDPRDISRLLARLAPPAAAGRRSSTAGARRAARRAAPRLEDGELDPRRRAQGRLPDTGCGIKVYWREAFLRLPYFTTMHRYLPALFRTYGHEVAHVPVNDRPRQVGVSKYNNVGRALVGLYDLVGVSWLRRRTRVPAIVEDLPEGRQLAGRISRVRPRARTAAIRR